MAHPGLVGPVSAGTKTNHLTTGGRGEDPLRTEGEAFSFVLAVALCFLAVGIAAVLGGPAAALASVLSLGLGAGIASI